MKSRQAFPFVCRKSGYNYPGIMNKSSEITSFDDNSSEIIPTDDGYRKNKSTFVDSVLEKSSEGSESNVTNADNASLSTHDAPQHKANTFPELTGDTDAGLLRSHQAKSDSAKQNQTENGACSSKSLGEVFLASCSLVVDNQKKRPDQTQGRPLKSALRRTKSNPESIRPGLKKTVSISDHAELFEPVSMDDTKVRRRVSWSLENDVFVQDGESIAEKLNRRVQERRLSLKEPPTPEVFTKGECTTQQAASSFRHHGGSVGEMSDVTAVREALLKEVEEEELDSDDEPSRDMETKLKMSRRKSISDAINLVSQISLDDNKSSEKPAVSSAKDDGGRRKSICEAANVVSQRRGTGFTDKQVSGVESLKDKLKSQIQKIESSENVTEKLQKRIQERKKSLSEPPKPNVYTKGNTTTKDAKTVMQKKISSVDEIHSSLDQAIGRINKYKAVLDDDSYKVKPFGKTHPKDVSVQEQSRSVLLNDLLDKRDQLETILNKNPAEKSGNFEVFDCNAPLSETSSTVDETETGSKLSSRSGSITKFIDDVALSSVTNGIASSQSNADARKLSRISSNLTEANNECSLNKDNASNSSKSSSSKKRKSKPKLSPDILIQNTLCRWRTLESVKFLLKNSKSAPSSESENQNVDFAKKYEELCKRLDMNKADVSDVIGDSRVGAEGEKAVPEYSHLKGDDGFSKKVKEFYGVKKRLSQTANGSSEKELVLPLVESHSQMAMRRKIVLDKLNKSLNELLNPLQLTARDISSDVRSLVSSFRFDSDNIALRPAEWTIVAFIILKLLCHRCCVLQRAFSHHYSSHYFNTLALSVGLTEARINDVIDHMTSVQSL